MSKPGPRTPRDLLNSLRRSLGSGVRPVATVSGANPTADDDLYEAYLFGLVLRAARNVGFRVSFENAGGPVNVIKLRASPGRIMAYHKKGPNFTHAVLEYVDRPPLELHTGVRISGKSKVAHEADLLLLRKSDADYARDKNVLPLSSKALLHVEAKFYSKIVGLNLAREFLGLNADISAQTSMFVYTIAAPSAAALVAGTRSVEYDSGVLPNLVGEASFLQFVQRRLRDYRDRQ